MNSILVGKIFASENRENIRVKSERYLNETIAFIRQGHV